MVVLEVPKIGFKIRLKWDTKIPISGIFHVCVKLQVRFYKAYEKLFFIVRIKKNY